MKIQLFPYFWYFGCLKASFPVFRHNLEVRPRPESCPKPGILKFPLNRKKIMFLAMCSWLHSKDTLPVPPASEKYLLPWVRLVKIRDFFSWINHKRSLDLKQQFLETEKFYLLLWDTWHQTVMPWTRSSNRLPPLNTSSDLLHLDKHWLIAVFSAGCTLGENELSAIWNAVSCFLELDSAFHWC